MKKEDIKAGQKFYSIDPDLYLKVMAVSEGYVMARYKRCLPFIESISMFQCRFASWNTFKPYDGN